APNRVEGPDRADSLVVACELIEQGHLFGGRKQLLLDELTMDVAQVHGQLAADDLRRHTSDTVATALTRSLLLTLDVEFAVLQLEAGLVEQLDEFGGRLGFEDAGDARSIGALADDVRRAAPAHQQRQSADDDRLAAAGLAGEQVESRAKVYLQAVDDGE